MDANQVKQTLEYMGVTNVDDVQSILKKLRQIDFDNSGILTIDPKTTTKEIVKFDYDNELIVMKELVGGKWRIHIKPFDVIQGMYGITGVKPPCIEFGIIEYEDGTTEDLGNPNYNGNAPRKTNLDYNDIWNGRVVKR